MYYANDDTMRRNPFKPLLTEDAERVDRIKSIGQAFHDLVGGLDERGSRELSLAQTKIEEAVMWAVKHVTK